MGSIPITRSKSSSQGVPAILEVIRGKDGELLISSLFDDTYNLKDVSEDNMLLQLELRMAEPIDFMMERYPGEEWNDY